LGKADALVAGAVFLAVVLVLAATCNSIGITYDEPNYVSASAKAWRWAELAAAGLAQGNTVAARAEVINRYWRQNHERPGFIKLWWGAWMRVGTPLGSMVQGRLGTLVLVGLLGAAMYLWLGREHGRGVGLLAVIGLLGMPRFFFHSHLAALDAPVAAFCLLAAWLFWRLWREPSWGKAVGAGLALGCAAGTKGNVLPGALAIGVWWLACERRVLGRTVLAGLVVAPVWFFVTWPWLWAAPVARLAEYATFHGKFPLLGAYLFGVMRDPAPWYTPVLMLVATTPLLTLALAALSIGNGRYRVWQFLALNFVLHWLYFVLPGQPKFNGVRLFLPAFPFLACLAAIGGHSLSRWVGRMVKGGMLERWGLASLCVALGIVGLRSVALSHPYELAFYNSGVGGAQGAQRLGLESIYWGSPYLQALPYLNKAIPPGGTMFVTPVGVMSLLETYQKGGALRGDIRILGGRGEHLKAHVVVFQCQQSEFVEVSWALYRKGRPTFQIAYEGVPLLLAYDRAAVEQVLNRPGTERRRQAGAAGGE